MLETLMVAGLTGLVIGALMLGKIISQQKGFADHQKAMNVSVLALHARFDVLVLTLSRKGVIDMAVMGDLMRHKPRETS